jgi:hypothetical protein
MAAGSDQASTDRAAVVRQRREPQTIDHVSAPELAPG